MHLILAAGAVPHFLVEIVAIVAAAALVAYVSQRIGLVPIVGFLRAGVLIGPSSLGLVDNPAVIEAAAEIGVLLLLFTIGIEFSVDTLLRIRRLILVGGGLQVLLATGLTAGAAMAFGVGWQAAVFTGFLVALSSTAIVTKLLGDRGETGTEPGQAAVGLLVFQDIAVILMVLLVPALGGGDGVSALSLGLALGKAALLVVVVWVVARRLLPPVLEHVARTCSPELFLLTIIAICLGTAFLVGLAGVSISLGAFLAGLVVSQSRFSEHALSEILPLQILFSATFFVSVGLLLDLGFLFTHLPLVAGLVGAVLIIKLVTTYAAVRIEGRTAAVAAATALWLAQVGEFSFVLERSGLAAGLSPAGLGEAGSQAFIATTVVLMALTPVFAPWAGRLARHIEGKLGRTPGVDGTPGFDVVDTEAEVQEAAAHFADLRDHVIIAGYGTAARLLARGLRDAGVPFVVATLSPDGAQEAEREGVPSLRGDYTKQHILDALGLRRARLLVVPDDLPAMARRVVGVARALAPDVHIVASVPTAADAEELAAAGADRAVGHREEAALGLLTAVLAPFDAAPDAAGLRAEHYAALAPPGGASSGAGAAEPPLPPPRPDPAPLPTTPLAAMPRPAQTADWISTTEPVTLDPDPRAACSHTDHIQPVVPGTQGCAECLAQGDRWVHLRICMTCGHVGCCDSSPNKHATAHFHATGHPVMRSIERGEAWGWCYVDRVEL